MKIAVVSSGLWHVQRGIETWALTLAEALTKRGADVTLFTGSDAEGDEEKVECKRQSFPCWYRGTNVNIWLTKLLSRIGGWRYGFGSEYQTEQTTMASGVIDALKRNDFDIVHLQDPWLALLLERARNKGRHKAKVILAHGTEEPVEFLKSFENIQELSPFYLERHKDITLPEQARYCIPNFVNTGEFKPADKLSSRRSLGLPEDSFIVLSVGAIDHKHKRMRRLVEEFALVGKKNALLVIAGPCGSEASFELISHASKLLGKKFIYAGSLSRPEMPALYSSADLFALCSKTEIFGIVFLEAMACGVPCVGHKYPVTEWIIGGEKAEGGNMRPEVGREGGAGSGGKTEMAGGKCLDMTAKGFLAGFLAETSSEWIRVHGVMARERVEKYFSTDVVVDQIMKMYEEVRTKAET